MANNVKLILLQDIESLGLAGSEVTVAPGYARNYLIPRGLAAKATPGILRVLAANKEKIEAKRQEELEAAQALSEKLAALNVEIFTQASEDGHLFGSVSDRMIADAIAANGIKLDHQRVIIPEAIRTLGDFVVTLKLHQKVRMDLNVKVSRAV